MYRATYIRGDLGESRCNAMRCVTIRWDGGIVCIGIWKIYSSSTTWTPTVRWAGSRNPPNLGARSRWVRVLFLLFLFPIPGAGARARPFLFFTLVSSPRNLGNRFDGEGPGDLHSDSKPWRVLFFCGCGLLAAVRCGRYGAEGGCFLCFLVFWVLGGILFFSFLWLGLDVGGDGDVDGLYE